MGDMKIRVYIGGLSWKAKEADVNYLFKKYGDPWDISLKKGFAFVNLNDDRDADEACKDLDGTEFMGEKLKIERAKGTQRSRTESRIENGRYDRSPRSRYDKDDFRNQRKRSEGPRWLSRYGPPTRTTNRLIVENLSYGISWQDLKDLMRQAGDVTFADAHRPRRNEGVVEFRDTKDLENAIKMLDNKEVKGQRIKLVKDGKRKRTRSRTKSRSRSLENRKSSNSQHSLIVKNLSINADWRDLKDYMRKAGEVRFCDAHQDRRNEGLVEFRNERDVDNAIRILNNTDLKGNRIELVKSRAPHRRSRSRSRSRNLEKYNKRRKSSPRTRLERSLSQRRKSPRPSSSRSKSRSKSRYSKRHATSRSKTRSRSRTPTSLNSRQSRSQTKSRSRSRSSSVRQRRSLSSYRSVSRQRSRSIRSYSRGLSRSRSRSRRYSRSYSFN